jgi:hypothetical protein
MKLTRDILIAGSIVTLAAVPTAYAGGGKCGTVAPAVEETTDAADGEDVVVDEGGADEGEVVDEGEVTIEPEIVICDKDKCEDIDCELVDPAVCEMTDGPEVQRDGDDKGLENPEVIFQNTAVDSPSPVAKAEAGFGSDERAASIQTKSAAMSQVNKEKKGPVALVKKGRVFLR